MKMPWAAIEIEEPSDSSADCAKDRAEDTSYYSNGTTDQTKKEADESTK